MLSDRNWYTSDGGGGFTIRVRAVPGAKKPGLAGVHGDRLKVRVSAPPEGGKANKAIAELLASALHVRAKDVSHASGVSSRDKVFRVTGADEASVRSLAE